MSDLCDQVTVVPTGHPWSTIRHQCKPISFSCVLCRAAEGLLDDITFDDPLPIPSAVADALIVKPLDGTTTAAGAPSLDTTTTTATATTTTTSTTNSLDASVPSVNDILGFEDDDLPPVDLSFLPLLALNKDPEEEQTGRSGSQKRSWGGKKLSLDGLTAEEGHKDVDDAEEGDPATDKEDGHENAGRSPAKPARELPPTRILLPGTIAAAATAAAASTSVMQITCC